MASLSFRDRFFSPPVAHALTSPSGILALGAGAAVGIMATIGTGGLAAPIVGGIVGGLLGYGGRVALALPKGETGPRIDPFGVDEPWRHAVQDAIQARNRFREALQGFKPGPLRDRLAEIGSRLDEVVNECWEVAKQGQQVAEARKHIDDRQVHWELQQRAAALAPGQAASPIEARTIEALKAQLATAERMDQLIRSTYDQLGLLNARLDETVTQAIELSVTNATGGLSNVGASVDDIVDSLTSLRSAMDSMQPAPEPTLGGYGAAPPTATATLPPPPSDQPGQAQTFPGS